MCALQEESTNFSATDSTDKLNVPISESVDEAEVIQLFEATAPPNVISSSSSTAENASEDTKTRKTDVNLPERIRTSSSGSDLSDASDTSGSSSSSYLSGIPIALRRKFYSQKNVTFDTHQPSSSGQSSSKNDSTNNPVTSVSPTPSTDSTATSEDGESVSSNETPFSQAKVLDFSYTSLDVLKIDEHLLSIAIMPNVLTTLNLSGNSLTSLPDCLDLLVNLEALDISSNSLTYLPESMLSLSKLNTLIASNNRLVVDSFPKNFGLSLSHCLKVLSLGGNCLTHIPNEILDLVSLQSLYLGGNFITEISPSIKRLHNLKVLYLGGNQLTTIPTEVGLLTELTALSLCENKLRTLPSSIALLRNLRSLGLHKNLLTALPPEIVKLRGLQELSLRNNPLVSRFVKDFTFECPSLLELAARAVKIHKVNYSYDLLPKCLQEYLSTARRCVNNKCKGVYFDARVEHIKFVDFCGIYRLPLLQYLCSPSCTSSNSAHPRSGISGTSDEDDSYEENDVPLNKLRRVLLG